MGSICHEATVNEDVLLVHIKVIYMPKILNCRATMFEVVLYWLSEVQLLNYYSISVFWSSDVAAAVVLYPSACRSLLHVISYQPLSACRLLTWTYPRTKGCGQFLFFSYLRVSMNNFLCVK